MSAAEAQIPSAEDHKKAFTEVAFLLDIFVATIDNIMGGSTASVGRIAGREMAKKLPFDIDHPTSMETLGFAAESLRSGFDISFAQENGQMNIKFDRCAVRDVCQSRNLPLGSPLCKLFHSYFDGIVNEILSRPTKSEVLETGSTCNVCMKIQ